MDSSWKSSDKYIAKFYGFLRLLFMTKENIVIQEIE